MQLLLGDIHFRLKITENVPAIENVHLMTESFHLTIDTHIFFGKVTFCLCNKLRVYVLCLKDCYAKL